MSAALDTNLDDTVEMLRSSIERYTADHYSFEQRWSALRSAQAYSPQAWSDYAQMGWLSLRLPEEAGGMAAEAEAAGALMQAVGSRLLLEPILASAILSTGLLLQRGSEEQKALMMPRLADGSLKLSLAHQESLDAGNPGSIECSYREGRLSGQKLCVLHGDCSDRFIVSAQDAAGRTRLCMVDANAVGLARHSFRLLDGRGAANLRFDAVAAEVLAAPGDATDDAAALAQALDEAAVALCSEALGVISALNAATNEYLKIRKQFGKPIGTNQALQHRMVEMYMQQQEVRALTLAAQRALRAHDPERTRIISGARAFACSAARHVAAEAVQLHGGIGITDELDISHYYRRVMVIGTLFGNRDFHLHRFALACEREAADGALQ